MSQALRNIFHLGLKELRGLSRDWVMLLLIVYSFTLSIYVESKAAPETLNRAAIAIVDEDQSPLTARLFVAFQPPYFTPPAAIPAPELDRRLDEGVDTFALEIPAGFQADLLAGAHPTMQLNVDATRISQAFTGTGYIHQIVNAEVGEFLHHYRAEDTPPVDLTLRARYNQRLDPGWFGAITHVVMSVTMLAIILTGAALIREKEHGTVEHLMVMPVTATELMLSKIWSMGMVVLLASGFAIAVMVRLILEVPVAGSVPLFMFGTMLMLFATTSLGIFLATIAGSMPQFGLLMILVLLPLQVLSGAMTPVESMPDAIRFIMSGAPNTHFIVFSQGVLFRGAGIDVVWPQLAAMAAIGAVLFWLALRRFRAFLR